MARFGKTSMARLEQAHPDLQRLFLEVVHHYDCTILCSRRGREEQEAAYFGTPQRSKVRWPNSAHNVADEDGREIPFDPADLSSYSRAIDAMPWSASPPHIRWTDQRQIDHFTGFVAGVAAALSIAVRAGHDWDGDRDLRDQRFVDAPHWELLRA